MPATWGTEAILVRVKGSGMPPLEATKLHVVMPDGSIASKKQMATIGAWPSARLRVIFGQSVNWYGKNKGAWHDAAVALVMKLAPLASPNWIVQDIIGRIDIPVLKPAPWKANDAKKIVGRALFDYQKYRAWACLRSGGPRDVVFDSSVLVTQSAVQVHLPYSEANVRKLAGVLDRVVADVPFAWAGVGRGTNGYPSAMALVHDARKPMASYAGTTLRALGQVAPSDGQDSLVWIGRAWCNGGFEDEEHEKLIAPALAKGREIARRDALVRISAKPGAPSKKLAADLSKVVGRAHDLARRAVLRKR
jgi:hypothetical protein